MNSSKAAYLLDGDGPPDSWIHPNILIVDSLNGISQGTHVRIRMSSGRQSMFKIERIMRFREITVPLAGDLTEDRINNIELNNIMNMAEGFAQIDTSNLLIYKERMIDVLDNYDRNFSEEIVITLIRKTKQYELRFYKWNIFLWPIDRRGWTDERFRVSEVSQKLSTIGRIREKFERAFSRL